jgi:hypothetical protein
MNAPTLLAGFIGGFKLVGGTISWAASATVLSHDFRCTVVPGGVSFLNLGPLNGGPLFFLIRCNSVRDTVQAQHKHIPRESDGHHSRDSEP